MKIVIPTKNREETIKTHRYFENCDYYVLVHNLRQFNKYKKYSDETGLNMGRVIITNVKSDQFGLTRQREWACENLIDKDEWFVFADDNIKTIQAVGEPFYNEPVLDVKGNKSLRDFYKAECSPDRFFEIVNEGINKADQYGVHHYGFSPVDNFFFRGKKWKEVAYIIGKLMVWHNTGRLQFDHKITMEDFELTAQSLLKFGCAMVNNYVYPVAGHYEKGGMGTVDERLKDRQKDVKILMDKYPGLFRLKSKDVDNPDLSLRFYDHAKVKQWRLMMKAMKGV